MALLFEPDGHSGGGGPPMAEGYVHELGLYASDEEFRALVVPFALGGLRDAEPVVFAYDTYKTELLRSWLPASPGISYVSDFGPYAAPAKALVAWRNLVKRHLSAGAPRARIAGNVPHPGYGRPYAGWDRYEAAIDRALGDLPVWAPCLYDARIAPQDVLAAALRRHRLLLGSDGAHRANGYFQPARGLADFLSAPPDPLEATAPVAELTTPTPAGVRAALRHLAGGILSAEQCDDLVLAASEAVANALEHGVPPVMVRIWRGEGRVVINVHDQGAGPQDPLAGLLPAGERGEDGRGLWMVHQLSIDVALSAAAGGFTVRLSAAA